MSHERRSYVYSHAHCKSIWSAREHRGGADQLQPWRCAWGSGGFLRRKAAIRHSRLLVRARRTSWPWQIEAMEAGCAVLGRVAAPLPSPAPRQSAAVKCALVSSLQQNDLSVAKRGFDDLRGFGKPKGVKLSSRGSSNGKPAEDPPPLFSFFTTPIQC